MFMCLSETPEVAAQDLAGERVSITFPGSLLITVPNAALFHVADGGTESEELDQRQVPAYALCYETQP